MMAQAGQPEKEAQKYHQVDRLHHNNTELGLRQYEAAQGELSGMKGRRGNEQGLQAQSPTSGFASSGLFPFISLSHVKPSPHQQHDLSMRI